MEVVIRTSCGIGLDRVWSCLRVAKNLIQDRHSQITVTKREFTMACGLRRQVVGLRRMCYRSWRRSVLGCDPAGCRLGMCTTEGSHMHTLTYELSRLLYA